LNNMSTVVPEVTWAQRSSSTEADRNYIYLTIVAADVPESDLKLDLKEKSLSFQGASTSKKVTYAVDLEFFAEIDPSQSKISHSGRDVSLVLRKKELKDEYWPRLLKDNKKMHFLKTDFDKWVDEDEQNEAPEDDMMNQMNPMAGGLGGAGGDGGFGGIDFSKLGAAQGAGGLPGMDAWDGGDSDDDEMPELENDEDSKDKEAPVSVPLSEEKPKIEEVA